MAILLHTIALEPARWTPRKTSQTFASLIPEIARYGFRDIEVFEPHLADSAQFSAIKGQLLLHGVEIKVLSSYLDLAKATVEEMEAAAGRFLVIAEFFNVQKIRVFAGMGGMVADDRTISLLEKNLAWIADRLPSVEILIETHDGSIADNPVVLTEILRRVGRRNVGLLFQPTIFAAAPALAQLEIQAAQIRHVHLQSRNAAGEFSTLEAGVVPWEEILRNLPSNVDLTIEFVPSGIVPVEAEFDLPMVLAEAARERAWVREQFRLNRYTRNISPLR